MFRVNGKPAIGLAIAMRDGGDILTLGRNVGHAVDESVANLPLGIDASLVSDQPVVVQTAIGEFMESLWQAIAIIMAVSIISLGLRPGSVVALTIPLTIAIVFPIMEAMHIDLQRISLGALIISLSLLVDSAMTTIDVMTTRLDPGRQQGGSGFVRLQDAGAADADRHFRHHRRLRADRLRPQRRRRIHVLDLRRGDDRAHRVVVRRGPVRAAARRLAAQEAGQAPSPREPNFVMRTFRSILVGAMRVRWVTIAVTLACFVASLLALPYVPRQFFPASDRPELTVDLTLAAKRLDLRQ